MGGDDGIWGGTDLTRCQSVDAGGIETERGCSTGPFDGCALGACCGCGGGGGGGGAGGEGSLLKDHVARRWSRLPEGFTAVFDELVVELDVGDCSPPSMATALPPEEGGSTKRTECLLVCEEVWPDFFIDLRGMASDDVTS